ncbi:MAG: cbb3-type cytochrome c oxidase N-terminal domain-containing protein [Pirellulaceae bacterium]
MSVTSDPLEEKVEQPVDPQEELLTDHSYDGIQEYDNPLPGWWTWLFIGSFFFAIFYVVYFHMGEGSTGRSIQDQYDRQAAEIFELRFAEIGELDPDEETILQYMNDQKWLAVGRVIYKTNCVSCHGAEGGGLVGPNLTDDHWKNVRKIEDIATVIQDGAANGSMPAWRNRMSHINQVVLTAAYVASMRGSGATGKSPEGDPIPPWPDQ